MPLMLKNITSTALGDTTGNNVVIGEEITYTVTLKVPEGQMTNVIATDVLDACLALTNLVSLNATSGITSSQGSMATVLSNAQVQSVGAGPANAARRIILDYGTLTNTNRDNSTDDIITLIYRAIPINASNCLNTNTRRNAITLEWNTAPNAQQLVTLSPLVTIREPSISVNKTFTPSSGDSATATRVRITVTAGSAPRSPAYNVALSDVLSSTNFDYQGNLSHFSGVAPDSLNESSGTVSATWAQLNPGQSSSIEFDVRLKLAYQLGQHIPILQQQHWMSLSHCPYRRRYI
jgi:phage FluMu protein gp41